MALIHDARLRPTKLDLVADWLPDQPWAAGEGEVRVVARFRFDDPLGEVGVETILVRRGDGPVLQVPLTYRGAPLEGADAWLITTMEHSVLGTRWVYDALGDPVYEAVVLEAVRSGAGHAAEFDADGRPVERPDAAQAVGNPGPESQVADVDLTVQRVLGAPVDVGAAGTLTASWDGNDPVVLAVVR